MKKTETAETKAMRTRIMNPVQLMVVSGDLVNIVPGDGAPLAFRDYAAAAAWVKVNGDTAVSYQPFRALGKALRVGAVVTRRLL